MRARWRCLGASPDVKHLRDRIGADIHRRLATALGPDVDPQVVRVLETSYFGALLMAGMGHLPYTDIPGFVAAAAELMVGDPARPPAPRATKKARS